MRESWGEGDARVRVGDTVQVWAQFDRRNGPDRTGIVAKIGRTLLHVNERGAIVTYYLATQQMTGQYSGHYETVIQRAKRKRRERTVNELAELGIVHEGGRSGIFRRDWEGWTTDQLIELCDAAARIKDVEKIKKEES